jgi:hypothetical protein
VTFSKYHISKAWHGQTMLFLAQLIGQFVIISEIGSKNNKKNLKIVKTRGSVRFLISKDLMVCVAPQ